MDLERKVQSLQQVSLISTPYLTSFTQNKLELLMNLVWMIYIKDFDFRCRLILILHASQGRDEELESQRDEVTSPRSLGM